MSVRVFTVLMMFATIVASGCSKSEPTATPSASTPQAAAEPSNDPAALAAKTFIEAVVRGDTEGATQALTPQAIQQFEASGQRFAAPGLDSAQFRMGQVRKVNDTQALVQCMLSEKTADGTSPEQEMCCIMKLVDGSWRVSGLAVDPGDGTPATILNFEQPAQPQAPPAATQQFATQPPAGTATPEIRTAQEPVPSPQ